MPHPSDLLSELQFVAFDLETTGLTAQTCHIVEFGAIRFQLDGTVLGCYEQLVDPESSIPLCATRVHGITRGMVRGMPTVAQSLPGFLDFLGSDGTILMAHNAPFDLSFLKKCIQMHAAPPINNPVIDTLQLARRAIPGMYGYGLENLAVTLELADVEEHRALSDARLVMGLFCRLVELRRDLNMRKQLFTMAPPHGSGTVRETRARQNHHHQHLALAIRQQLTLVMVYEGGTKGLSDRRVTPRRLVRARGANCLVAYCHTDHVEKTFRLDRIRELRAVEP